METARQRPNYKEAEWVDKPWSTQEKPTWFHLGPIASKNEKKNVLSFIFDSSRKPYHSNHEQTVQKKNKNSYQPSIKTAYRPQQRISSYKGIKYYQYHWIEKEVFFAMNKMSIAGMVIGLMFLGALFFISGFLLAINLYSSSYHPFPEVKASVQTPLHRASNNVYVSTHRPAPPPATVPNQYATVGGVSMAPASHKPSQAQVENQGYTQPPYNPSNFQHDRRIAPPVYPSSPYPPVNYAQTAPVQPMPQAPVNPAYSPYPHPVASYPPATTGVYSYPPAPPQY